jgi:hypothetical protein
MELLKEGEDIDFSSDRLRPNEMLEGLGRLCRFAEKEGMFGGSKRLQITLWFSLMLLIEQLMYRRNIW